MVPRARRAECSSRRSPYLASYRIARKILRRVVDEREVVEHPEDPRRQVLAATERVDEAPEVGGLERHRHGVDREVAAKEIFPQAGALDGRESAWRVVELGSGRHDVDATTVPVLDDRRAELLVRRDASVQCGCKCARERDRIAFHGDVDIEVVLSQKDVPNGPTDEVDALGALAERRHRLEHGAQAIDGCERAGKAHASLHRLRLHTLEGAQEVRARDDTDQIAVAHEANPSVLRRRHERLQLSERRHPRRPSLRARS